MKVRSKLIILLIITILIAQATLTFAAPPEEGGETKPDEVDVDFCETYSGPPVDEPMPCTNQRAKAWFGCS
jgi:hypothetical protein